MHFLQNWVVYLAEILYRVLFRTLIKNDVKMKKSVTELGHSDGFKIYVDPYKILHQPWHLSPFLQNGLVYFAEILYGV